MRVFLCFSIVFNKNKVFLSNFFDKILYFDIRFFKAYFLKIW